MANARMEILTSSENKQLLEIAAILSGAESLADYIINHMIPVAERDIVNATTITLSLDQFDEFMATCDNAASPNKALSDAFESSKAMGFN